MGVRVDGSHHYISRCKRVALYSMVRSGDDCGAASVHGICII